MSWARAMGTRGGGAPSWARRCACLLALLLLAGCGPAFTAPERGASGSGCDWQAARCSALTCAASCPVNSGQYCVDACDAVVTCVQDHPDCGTASDPLCVERQLPSGMPNVCTTAWETAGGPNMSLDPSSPASVASHYVSCACGS